MLKLVVIGNLEYLASTLYSIIQYDTVQERESDSCQPSFESLKKKNNIPKIYQLFTYLRSWGHQTTYTIYTIWTIFQLSLESVLSLFIYSLGAIYI